MATLKEIKTKISGVKKTKQITSAMKMVATSRLRGAQMNMEAFKPYANKYAEVLGSLSEKAGDNVSPLLQKKDKADSIHIILCSSDKGLCGGFNVNIFKKLDNFIQSLSDENVTLSFTNFGKRGRDLCRKEDKNIIKEYLNIMGAKFDFSFASQCGEEVINKFLSGEYDKVYVVYSDFVSMSKQEPKVKQLLPIPPIEKADVKEDDNKKFLAEHIYEPDIKSLMSSMLPKSVYIQIYDALLSTSTSEHAARMTAMENATKACTDIIDELQTVFNKARQAAITLDLMDIIGGANALKG